MPSACYDTSLDDQLEAAIVDELSLNYGNWMADVGDRLRNIPLVRARLAWLSKRDKECGAKAQHLTALARSAASTCPARTTAPPTS
jgi:uncharacterized protein YecT (DUF1311 family)